MQNDVFRMRNHVCNDHSRHGAPEGPDGYDAFYNGARPQPKRPLTSKTVSEVRAWQRLAANRRNCPPGALVSSAAGRYQIVSGTMDHLIESLGLTGNEPFNAAMQDRMALFLLHEAGWPEFLSSQINLRSMGTRIAHVWAAFPALNGPKAGRSVYHGFNGNRATQKQSEFLAHNPLGSRLIWPTRRLQRRGRRLRGRYRLACRNVLRCGGNPLVGRTSLRPRCVRDTQLCHRCADACG